MAEGLTDQDVTRLVQREFGNEAEAATRLLDRYGTESHHREVPRVRAALLRIADGSLVALEEALATAMRDYRDTLVGAEYAREMALGLAPKPAALKKARQQDADELRAWLEG